MPRSGRGVLILGSFFTTNLGDHAILAAQRRLVAELCGREVTPFPFKAGRFTGDTTDWRLRKAARQLYHVPVHFLRLFRQARAAGAVVIGGGNLLEDHSRLTPFLTLLTCLVIRAAGARFRVLAVGAGPFRYRVSRHVYRACLSLADRVSVRDPISHDLLSGLIAKHKLELVCDPALTLPPGRRSPAKKRRTVGIVIGPHHHPQYDYGADAQEFRTYLQNAGRMVNGLAEKYGWDSVLLFMSDPPADRAALDDLHHSGHVRADQITLRTPSTLDELLVVVREVDVIVSTRLHPILLGISQGTPAVGLNVESKIQGFYASLNLGEYCIALDACPERLIAATDDLIQNPERFVDRFTAASLRYMRDLKSNIRGLCGPTDDNVVDARSDRGLRHE